jgi:hypothetical protein
MSLSLDVERMALCSPGRPLLRQALLVPFSVPHRHSQAAMPEVEEDWVPLLHESPPVLKLWKKAVTLFFSQENQNISWVTRTY